MTRRQFVVAASAAAVLDAASSVAAEPAGKFRVAVIGHTGRGNYGHGVDTMWLNLPEETVVVAVADPDAKGLAGEAKRLPGARLFTDYKEMLAEMKPDIVAVAPRWIDQHRDMILAAVAAGARGIYMEKPFCRSLAEADEIVSACAAKNVRLALAHRNRYHPVLPVLQQMVQAGEIGKLLEFRGRGKEDHRGGGLDLWVLGCHLFNLCAYFGGRPLACSATIFQQGKPAVKADIVEGAEGIGLLVGNEVHARFDMECGVPAYFDSVQNAGVAEANFGLQLVGTKGIIDLRIDVEPLAQLLRGNPYHPTKEPRNWIPISSAGVGVAEPLQSISTLVASHLAPAKDLIQAIRTDRQPLCGAEDGRVTVEMISAVMESHIQSGKRIEIPLKKRENPLSSW